LDVPDRIPEIPNPVFPPTPRTGSWSRKSFESFNKRYWKRLVDHVFLWLVHKHPQERLYVGEDHPVVPERRGLSWREQRYDLAIQLVHHYDHFLERRQDLGKKAPWHTWRRSEPQGQRFSSHLKQHLSWFLIGKSGLLNRPDLHHIDCSRPHGSLLVSVKDRPDADEAPPEPEIAKDLLGAPGLAATMLLVSLKGERGPLMDAFRTRLGELAYDEEDKTLRCEVVRVWLDDFYRRYHHWKEFGRRGRNPPSPAGRRRLRKILEEEIGWSKRDTVTGSLLAEVKRCLSVAINRHLEPRAADGSGDEAGETAHVMTLELDLLDDIECCMRCGEDWPQEIEVGGAWFCKACQPR
jgi:hypothetical protein